MPVKMEKEAARPLARKFLVSWTLTVGHADLARLSGRPDALGRALKYVQDLAKESGLEIYRFVPVEELTRHARPGMILKEPVHPSGIALLKAPSLEEARRMVDEWVTGLSYGGAPVGNYLDYEILPLAELGRRGGG
jgi:hypothetical protein